MTWRKVLVRGLVFTVLGGFVLIGILYRSWTNPRAVREQVIAKLSLIVTGGIVSVESAHLRLFGGIVFSDLRLARRDDLSDGDFLYVPAGIIYHDKQQILDGNFSVRKCELNRLRLRLVRERDGSWNVQGLFAPSEENQRIPTMVIQQGTVVFEDRSIPGSPLLEIHDVNMTVLNDPLDLLVVEGKGIADVAGPVEVRAHIYRDSGRADVNLRCPNVPVGPSLVQRLSLLAPDLAVHLRNLRGDGRITASLHVDPQATPMVAFDTTIHLHGGELSHALLPVPLQHVEVSLRCLRGPSTSGSGAANNALDQLRIPSAHFSARSGEMVLAMELEDLNLPLPLADDDLVNWQNHVREFECKADNLWLTPQVWDSFPEFLQKIRQNYKPGGLLDLRHNIVRDATGQQSQEWFVRAQKMTGQWIYFPYPVHDIEGTLLHKTTGEGEPSLEVHVIGKAGSGAVKLDGTLTGENARDVDLVLEGTNIVLDRTLFDSLDDSVRAIAAPYNLQGKVSVTANIDRLNGEPYRNHYRIVLADGKVRYDQFPYPLENATGTLDITPDSWVLHELRGYHKGGEMVAQARSFPPQQEATTVVQANNAVPVPTTTRPEAKPTYWTRLHGKNVLVDKDLERALAPVGSTEPSALQMSWKSMVPSGRINFVADIIDRQTTEEDLDVTVYLNGPTVKPRFFDYKLNNLSGRIRYYKDRVYLNNLQATHGPAVFEVPEGQIFLKREGGYQVRLAALKGTSVIPNAEFLRALPLSMRKGFEALDLKGPIDWGTALVIDPPSEGSPPVVWWDGSLFLDNASMNTGIDWTGVKGQIWCRGRYDGERLESVIGGVSIDEATVLKQPIKNLRCRLEVSPSAPESLRFRHLTAEFFEGAIGGEARIDFGETFRYDLYLKALQVNLEKFGKHNGLGSDAELQGRALGALHLMGEGTDVGNLRGNGRLDVPNGKLYRLPLLLDLLKAFGLRVPDRTAFEQAHLTFGIEGTQMLVQDLDLIGNAISLRGRGSLNLDGSDLNLLFNTDWARMAQLLPPGITEIPRTITDQLFQIKMQGRIGEVKFEKELVPGVTDPLKRIIGIN